MNKSVPLKACGRVYQACLRPVLCYGSETWAMTKTNLAILERADMKMLSWMCRVKWEDRVSNDEILGRVGLEKLEYVLRRNRLRWFGHVERSEPENQLRSMEKEGNDDIKAKGRPRMTSLYTNIW